VTASPRVSVIGGGIAGITAALAFRGIGWDAELIERRPGLQAGGAGIVLHPNAMAALEHIGLAEAVLAAGTVLDELVLEDDLGVVSIGLGAVWQGSCFPTVGVGRAALMALLEQAVRGAGIGVRTGVPVEAALGAGSLLEVQAEGAPLAADLVVAADGVASSIRGVAAPTCAVRPLGLWWARWLVDASPLGSHRWSARTAGCFTAGGYAVGGGQTHLFLQGPASCATDVSGTLAQAYEEFPLLQDGVNAGAELIHQGVGHSVWPHCWSVAGIAFVGDASHAMSPTTSEGGGLAIEDGVALAASVAESPSIAQGLQDYEGRRAQRVRRMARVSEIQVRSALSGKPRSRPLGAKAATEYMRAMYQPLIETL